MEKEKNIFEAIKYIRDQTGYEYEDLIKTYSNELVELDINKVQELINLRKVLIILENKINLYKEGILFVESVNSKKSALNINKLGLKVENLINQNFTLEDFINDEWVEETISKNANFMIFDEIKFRFNKLRNEFPKDYEISLSSQKNQTQKLKWLGGIKELGFIMSELARCGYIERPTYPHGGKNQVEFSLQIHSAFETGKPATSINGTLKNTQLESIATKFENKIKREISKWIIRW